MYIVELWQIFDSVFGGVKGPSYPLVNLYFPSSSHSPLLSFSLSSFIHFFFLLNHCPSFLSSYTLSLSPSFLPSSCLFCLTLFPSLIPSHPPSSSLLRLTLLPSLIPSYTPSSSPLNPSHAPPPTPAKQAGMTMVSGGVARQFDNCSRYPVALACDNSLGITLTLGHNRRGVSCILWGVGCGAQSVGCGVW